VGIEAKAAPEGWLTVSDIATRLGVGPTRVLQLVKAGRLRGGITIKRSFYFPPDVLNANELSGRWRYNSVPHGAPDGWMTVIELTKRLGRNRPGWILKGMKEGKIPSERILGRVMFAPETVDTLLAAHEEKENRRARQRARVDAAQKLQNWLAQGWLTSKDLCERLGLTQQRIQQLRVNGRFPGAIRIGKLWVFPHDAVAILQATKREPKAPGVRAQMRAEGWLTTKDVAESTGLAQSRVFKLTTSGKLTATQNGSQWFYRPNDVERFQAEHRAMAQMRADGWLTAKQVVQRLGVSYPLVLHYRKSGKLAGTRIGARWFFRPDDVETLRVQREQREQRPQGGMVETMERMRAEGWLNTKDVAERLGVSYRSALKIAKSGQLAATRTGSHLFYRPDDVKTLRLMREHDDMVARQQREQVPGATQVGGRWIFPRYAVQRSTTGPAGSNP